MQVGWRWKVFSAFLPSWRPPPGTARSSGRPAMRRPGTKSKCQSCPGQGQDRRASALFACFYCCGVLWGEPGWTQGEHANSTQKGPGTSPDMLHDAGLEPTTFLLWGSSATHWATVPHTGMFWNTKTKLESVCVVGWSSLSWLEAGWLVCGWVRLHTCDALANQGPQVEPAVKTVTQEEREYASLVPPALSAISTNSNCNDPDYSTPVPCVEPSSNDNSTKRSKKWFPRDFP